MIALSRLLQLSYSLSKEDVLSYSVASPYQSQDKSHLITVQELAQFIKKQRVLFYTGAGISASVVPTMEKLEYIIGFTRNGKRLDGIKTITTMISIQTKSLKTLLVLCKQLLKLLSLQAIKH